MQLPIWDHAMTRNGKRAWLAALSLLLFAALVVLARQEFTRSHKVESRFITMAEAADSSTGRNGWLPDFMPDSAYAIHELHDVSTNMCWGTFRQDATSELELERYLSGPPAPYVLDIPREPFNDWPIRASGKTCSENLTRARVGLYEESTKYGRRQFVVVLLPNHLVAYWTFEGTAIQPGPCARGNR
jgi:hypothetical protein